MRKTRTAIATTTAIFGLMLGLAAGAQAETVIAHGTQAENVAAGMGYSLWTNVNEATLGCESSAAYCFAETESYEHMQPTKGIAVLKFNANIPLTARIEEIRARVTLHHFPFGTSGLHNEYLFSLVYGGEVKAMQYLMGPQQESFFEQEVQESPGGPWKNGCCWTFQPTAEQINNASFGIMFQGDNMLGPAYSTLGVKNVELIVTYSVPLGASRALKAAK